MSRNTNNSKPFVKPYKAITVLIAPVPHITWAMGSPIKEVTHITGEVGSPIRSISTFLNGKSTSMGLIPSRTKQMNECFIAIITNHRINNISLINQS